ncbi:Cell fate regulator YaaT, PSP1 superfamily (controls sporulation, competence, biofilm development) [Selenomonas ruminantium]|uniref:Cell fate regulator YaaT, PSP1 superfamily (Controls sporulation, competence, biofilm development) n=1 Tax=Selenomonas ruminantium TaxID=971 RepID=A0A1M6T2T7_SELRU|nr:stage 0 sporulation family protein [Selenomonas ruminantium]SHK51312.1 Cell fate regulator YaaT, PSP1 superfamily (controls sporulation, competence, biofilm development) [Selenomonas ruminantium]
MQTIIGVRFKKAGKIYYFAPGHLDIKIGDRVIVETARGMECGETVIGPREEKDENITLPLKVVHRIANDSDIHRIAENKAKEKEAYGICEEKIAAHGLPMKLVEVEYTFDMNKIIFYFTADGRIDFRELVKDLAAVFRTRIELRQIGVRDEAKFMGGIGCCGRPLCCASFLGDFEPVSIRMAKDQNLSLNPTKISGICGRLMCCLKYENDCYCGGDCPHQQKKIQPPAQGSRVVSVEGEGKVISLNQQRRSATILLDNGRTIVASWEDVIEKDEEETSLAATLMAAYEEQEKVAEGIIAEDFGHDNSGQEKRHERRERRSSREGRDNNHRSHRGNRENRENKENRQRNFRENRQKNNGKRDRRNRDKREKH